jgi:hypothetical protein
MWAALAACREPARARQARRHAAMVVRDMVAAGGFGVVKERKW